MIDPAPSRGRRTMVTGLFRKREDAERAYRDAIDLGYENAQINLLMSDETRERFLLRSSTADIASDSDLAPATELGGPLGGTIGTIAPVLAAVGTLLLIPGIIVAGPLAVALTAAGTVGLAGGLVGALVDWGIPKERVREYETGIRDGGILIVVEPRSEQDARQLQRQWQVAGGELVHS